ncbi:MAG: hypothetical protein KGS61_04980, partial [Verrucomicrobia bacterium]|nr:hypothetical protein [Verrucomicrobiota bacterium]
MKTKSGGCLFLALQLCLGAWTLQAQQLLDVDFGIGVASHKKGFAAAGQTSTDFWNLYSRDDGMGGYRTYGVLTNLLWADGSPTAISLTVSNAPGAWGTGSPDPMFATYLYPFNRGNIQVTLSGTPPSTYDVYLYGHGATDRENGIFTLVSGSAQYGPKFTATVPGWNTTNWVEGQQYVVFKNVQVAAGQPLVIIVAPGSAGEAVINGLQLVEQPTTVASADLIDVQFTAAQNWAFTNKVGFAAIGQSATDYWNVYSRDDGLGGFRQNGQVPDLKYVDGRDSYVNLSVSNAPGFWYTSDPDPMMAGYLYPLGGGTNISIQLIGLSAGTYAFYVYAHGLPDQQNGIIDLQSGSTDYGQKATTTSHGWNTAPWQEGIQYVLFQNVNVANNSPVIVTVMPGAGNLAALNGMQILAATNPASSSPVVRTLPASYTAGVPLTVTLQANPPPTTSAYAVQDGPPAGWAVSAISNNGAYDSANNLVKFGPFTDAQPRTLTYVVTPPPGTTAVGHFTGIASFDGGDSLIGGDADLAPGLYHPADFNPSDWTITIDKLTAYGAAWKRGDTWPLPPNPIPISYVTRAAFLWKGGEVYRYDSSITNAPFFWVNVPQPQIHTTGTKSHRLMRLATSTAQGQAVAALAAQYQPGQPLPVSINVTPDPDIAAYAVEDQLPAGWQATSISSGGTYDAISGKVKWGPYFDSTARTLIYQANPASGAVGPAEFTGVASFDGANVAIGGERVATWGGLALPALSAINRGLRSGRFD